MTRPAAASVALLVALAPVSSRAAPGGGPVRFEVLPSTRVVLAAAAFEETLLLGTSGGLVVMAPPSPERQVLLPGVPVRAIAVAPRIAYLGTDQGLYALRGGALTRLSPRLTHALTLDGDRLWSGHEAGHTGAWDVTRDPPRAIPDVDLRLPSRAPVHGLVPGPSGPLAATVDGLWGARAGKLHPVSLDPGDPLAGTITRLTRVRGRTLAGTPAGLFERRAGAWIRLGAPAQPHVTALARGRKGVLVGTAGEGVLELTGDRLTEVSAFFADSSALVTVGDQLYVGTPTRGAWRFGEPHTRLWELTSEPPGNVITSLAVARRYPALAVGTFEHGLGLLRDGSWRHHGADEAHGEALPSSWINQVASNGHTLLARLSDGRVLSQIEPARFRQLGGGDGWPKNWTSSLGTTGGERGRAREWVGTTSAIYLRTFPDWEVLRPDHLDGAMVLDVAEDADVLWVATHRRGLLRWDRRRLRWVDYGLGTGLPDSWVTAVETFRGAVWAGTFEGGLARLPGAARPGDQDGPAPDAPTPGVWEQVTAASGKLPSDAIQCLLATPGDLWIGTLRGLVWTDGDRFATFDHADGLAGTTVFAAAEDGEHLWVGTNAGLARAPLASLRAEARRRSASWMGAGP